MIINKKFIFFKRPQMVEIYYHNANTKVWKKGENKRRHTWSENYWKKPKERYSLVGTKVQGPHAVCFICEHVTAITPHVATIFFYLAFFRGPCKTLVHFALNQMYKQIWFIEMLYCVCVYMQCKIDFQCSDLYWYQQKN